MIILRDWAQNGLKIVKSGPLNLNFDNSLYIVLFYEQNLFYFI